MREIELTIRFQAFDKLDELPDDDQLLLFRAKEATLKSRAPYSGFNVGCAILLDNGEIVTAGNVENAAYPACLCAERVALSAVSAQYPDAHPVRIAVTVNAHDEPVEDPVAPCGECRQTLLQYQKRAGHPIEVILRGETGRIYKLHSVIDLLPLPFYSEKTESN